MKITGSDDKTRFIHIARNPINETLINVLLSFRKLYKVPPRRKQYPNRPHESQKQNSRYHASALGRNVSHQILVFLRKFAVPVTVRWVLKFGFQCHISKPIDNPQRIAKTLFLWSEKEFRQFKIKPGTGGGCRRIRRWTMMESCTACIFSSHLKEGVHGFISGYISTRALNQTALCRMVMERLGQKLTRARHDYLIEFYRIHSYSAMYDQYLEDRKRVPESQILAPNTVRCASQNCRSHMRSSRLLFVVAVLDKVRFEEVTVEPEKWARRIYDSPRNTSQPELSGNNTEEHTRFIILWCRMSISSFRIGRWRWNL